MTATVDTEMTCQEFVELVTDLIEGQLDAAARAGAEAHLEGCDGCTRYLEQMRLTVAGLRRLAGADDFPRAREQALAAFQALKANGGGAAPGG